MTGKTERNARKLDAILVAQPPVLPEQTIRYAMWKVPQTVRWITWLFSITGILLLTEMAESG